MELAGNDALEKGVEDNFKSAEMTAQWEMQLSEIAQGKSSKKNF
jgi:DNA topoisomerase